ncbi:MULTISPECIES: YbaB/EbfC family nucleoid-associated protein [Rhodococcus]|uniref:YbaB/EbfC DNA-binding family protein n=2 Tax=Rhodococcus TaxID=1827 RepID=M2ZEW2_9NOCA|nr:MULTISPECIES: YbaB/EbfC family nucleoid-associated protein [Rhodococcus]EME65837.1 hypothetical protein G352_08147 [Rhodococcus ruber BKS 20-38]KOS56803.1 hypothetical protein Z051_07745 [Rhodococcus rhodochrous KG-21]
MSASDQRVTEIVESVRTRLGALQDCVAALGVVSGTATSPDGLVRAEVDGNGALTGLWLAEALRGHHTRDVTASILATAHEAARVAAAERARLLGELRGALG